MPWPPPAEQAAAALNIHPMSTRLAGAGRVAMPLCLLLCAVPAHGPSAAEPESIMVTGSRLPGAVRADDSNVTVLDRAQIEERHASSVVELLRTIPGMVVEQAGGRGSVASVFTRGAKPNFTLVLLDGVRLNDPTNTRGGSFDFATLSLDDIDRVEIIRSPSSAIYGSDAVGGVINIITRKGTDHFTGDAEAAIGQYGFWQSAAELRGPVAGATASLGVSRLDNGRPVDGSQFRGSVLNGSVTAAPWDRAKLVLTGRYSVSDAPPSRIRAAARCSP
jgi:vitamin B12 transporter